MLDQDVEVASDLNNSTMQYTPLTDESSVQGALTAEDDEKKRARSKNATTNGLSQPLTDIEAANGGPKDDDPFYVFREDLLRKVSRMDGGLVDYLRVVHGTDSAGNSSKVKECRRQLKRFVKDAEATLKDLRTTVRAVESKRDKFLHIDDEELYDRRALVDSSLNRIANVKAAMQSNEVKAKLMADERALNLRRGGTNQEMTDLEKEETAFIADSQANTTMMLQQQDDTLDELDDAVQRVGDMAENIHEELGHQNKMLADLDDDLADAEEKLGLVMGKLAKFLKTNNKWHLGSIACLVLVVIILFLLVLYT